MPWWMPSHVWRYHHHYRSHGHVWQGRFKRFPSNRMAIFARLFAMFFVIRFERDRLSTPPIGHGRVCDSRICTFSSLLSLQPNDCSGSINRSPTTLRTCVNRQQPFDEEKGVGYCFWPLNESNSWTYVKDRAWITAAQWPFSCWWVTETP